MNHDEIQPVREATGQATPSDVDSKNDLSLNPHERKRAELAHIEKSVVNQQTHFVASIPPLFSWVYD